MAHVIGVDPSLTATGIAHTSGVTTTSKGGAGDARLVRLYTDVLSAALSADYAVIEDLPKQAMGAGLTGRAQGVVRLALVRSGVPFVEVSPASLKQFATGKGNADKVMMAKALYEHLVDGESVVVQPGRGVNINGVDLTDDNQVDAFFLRQMGLVKLGLVEGTEAQHAVLNKITVKKGKKDKPAIDWSPWEMIL